MTSTISRLDLIQFNSGTLIKQVNDQSWDTAIQPLIDRGAGGIYPKFQAVQGQEPRIPFTTPMLSTLLGEVPLIGAAIGAALNTYFKKGSQTGNVARVTAQHQRATVNYGYIYIERINLPHRGPGTADVVIVVGYDGTNEPIVATGSVALASTIGASEVFGAGPVYVNNVQLASVKNITIETGITLLIESSESDIWPTLIGMQEMTPVITVETTEVSPLITTGVDGIALNGTNGIVAYGRKFTNNQAGSVSRVDNATEEHLEFTMLNGSYHTAQITGSGNTPIGTTVRAGGTSADDATVPITVDITAAIP